MMAAAFLPGDAIDAKCRLSREKPAAADTGRKTR